MWNVRKETNATEIWRCHGLYTAGKGYFWSLCRRTNYTQVTATLGVTLSNFYPIVCVHTSWLSYQYVCVMERDRVCVDRRGVCGCYICVYASVGSKLCLCVCVCVLVCVVGLCWPAWLGVHQSCWISVSQLSHLLQRSCKLLTVPGWL